MIKKNTNKKIIALLALVAVFLFIFFYFNSSSPTGNTVAVLNKQAHPSLHGNWTISFSTKGTSNLLIKPVNGTSWQDLKPLQLLCGEQPVSFKKNKSHILVEDYSCPTNSSLTNKVLTLGVHNLMFNYAGETSYAHNLAGTSVCGVSFSSIAYEFNSSTNQDILSIDCSGNLYIAAPSFTNGSGITVPDPNGGFGISNSTHNLFMFNSSHAYVKGSVLDDQTGLSGGSDDVLVRNATNGANLTLFQGTGDLKTMGTAVYDGSDNSGITSCSDVCYDEVCDINTGTGNSGDPCQQGDYCSGGDCESGLCNSTWHFQNCTHKYQLTCDGSGECNQKSNWTEHTRNTSWGGGYGPCNAPTQRCFGGDCVSCSGWLDDSGGTAYCWYSGSFGNDEDCYDICSARGGIYPANATFVHGGAAAGPCDWIDDPPNGAVCLHWFSGTSASPIGVGPVYSVTPRDCASHAEGISACSASPTDMVRQCACND